ncbi:hypothetical protein GCM10022243_60020 [Saccharothrix violaceirubra]|uniref:Uncharacterized protein n=1 Tax=Saccharothrix violaceirubra TaxID=413306 RepID=A0A7W7T7G4_9PSEU|nr:hypothetical protein [Saccharothrix violaceirubra]MBB4967978.1 hypothetical protein [Saccharothrix violaceirubra]
MTPDLTIRDLLFRDVDGEYSTEPDTVIDGAATEPRYLERVPALKRVLAESTERYHRYLAVVALATWGEPEAYPIVERVAREGRDTEWFGMFKDVEGRDTTFPTIAGAVAEGRTFAVVAGGENHRLDAVRALLARAGDLYFGWQLRYAADDPLVADALADAVGAAIGVERTDFDVELQLADLITVLAGYDRERAVDLAERLLATDRRMIVRTHLSPVVPFRA